MFQEIISTTYSKGVNGFFFNCNAWVNESNKWWYSYEDVIECLEIPQQKADKMIRYEIPEEEQCTCYDSNNYDIHGVQHTIPRQFISSEMVRQLIKRNNERNNSFIKFMNNIEYAEDSHVVYNEDEEILEMMNKIAKSIEDKDYEEFFYQSYKVNQTQSSRETLDRLEVINKEKEGLIDLIREDLYYYDEVIGYTAKLKKKDREVKIKYKKNQESTCPSWIRDLI